MDRIERTNYYRKKSSKTKKEIEKQISLDKQDIISNIPKARMAGSNGQRQCWILICPILQS